MALEHIEAARRVGQVFGTEVSTGQEIALMSRWF